LENAVDAGATSIKLVVKDAGKTLIQVIDNGCGMSETDARMCFERHATSKIKQAKDLFTIRTMGFRGEAMASIAAIAHVELRTRRNDDEVGTRIVIEGSKVTTQESCQCASGTIFAIKNLFYNVPARRNFLKTNTVEMRHIIDEFQRVSLAYPDIFFSLHHNGSEMFHLHGGNLRQRIVGLLGQHTNKKLVPVEEDTDVVKITGYVGKAEFAKKTRGEQFFFVNERFIKSGYLNHAVMTAYEDILPKGHYPLYALFIEIDPARVDINVHPTKQEIKFDDERLLYNYLKVTIRHALAQYNVTPTLDFNPDPTFSNVQQPQYLKKESNATKPESTEKRNVTFSSSINSEHRHKNNLKHWQTLYDGLDVEHPKEEQQEQSGESITIESKASKKSEFDDDKGSFSKEAVKQPYQIHNTYIVSQIRSGFMLIDQQAAHERILYEKYLNTLEEQEPVTQKELFTKTIKVSPSDAPILKEMLEEINLLGFDIREFGNDSFVVHGVPANITKGMDEQKLIDIFLEQYKMNINVHANIKENIARSLASSATIKRGKSLTTEEMRTIIDELFACKMPYKSPGGKNCFTTFDLEALGKRFE
jgi:DNA mismatch repair protein MutL